MTFNSHVQKLNLCWHITGGYNQCLLTPRFITPSIHWGVSAPGGKMRKQLLNFLNNSAIFIIENSTFNIFAFQKALIQYISIWKIALNLVIGAWDTIILWQDAGPCCEQTQAAFEVGLSRDQGPGIYSWWADVDGSSQVRLCHTCIIDVMHSDEHKHSLLPCCFLSTIQCGAVMTC